jgi:hypothetical protein
MRAQKSTVINAGIPAMITLAVVLVVIMTVGGVWTSARAILAARRRKSRKEKALSNRYMLPEGYVGFNSKAA